MKTNANSFEIECETVGITSILLCENIGLKYAGQITNMQVNMQLIELGIASDFKGCMLDICR